MTTGKDRPNHPVLIFWATHRQRIMETAILLMCIASVVWLTYQFRRLLFEAGRMGAIDLRQRYDETHSWFSGENVYGALSGVPSDLSTYPPASFALVWPLTGWLDFQWARWLWAATTVLCLYWLARIFLRHGRARDPLERVFIVLLPLCVYATGATIGNGQLILHVTPCLVAALMILAEGNRRWREDLMAAVLFVLAMVKPSVTVPFFWLVLFTAGRVRPVVMVAAGYLLITLLAGSFQTAGIIELMAGWMRDSSRELQAGAPPFSYGNLHSLLFRLGMNAWLPFLSAAILLGLGVWLHRFRRADIWVLMGVSALVSRFYTYHGWYDDVLVLLPMVGVFRLLKEGRLPPGRTMIAAGIFIATLLFMLAPGGLYLLPMPWNRYYIAAQSFTFLLLLAFLLHHAWRTEHDSRRGARQQDIAVPGIPGPNK